jgi:cyclic pyranopterin phosphate synthase
MSIGLPILRPDTTDVGRMPPAAPEKARRPGRLVDSHGRTIRDLRLSVTDRCNYRCVYCMDPDFRYMPKQELLSLEEYLTVARVGRSLGIRKLRITGGEPTLYTHLNELVAGVGAMGFDDIAMTTNGSLLDRMPLQQWRRDGLDRITLSLDSLRPERVAEITRSSASPDTMIAAIRLGKAAGFDPIKINAVVMRDYNDDELADFADFARRYAIDLRLIEFMPLDSSRAWTRETVVTADEMLAAIGQRHELVPVESRHRDSTSLNFRFADGAPGGIGIIASVSRPFCGACSRLRVTADGKVRPCLFSHEEWDLRALLRDGADDDDIRGFLADSMWTKQAGHGIGTAQFTSPARTMSGIGG